MSSSDRKIGRNDPCLCGSGKKYKKCCLLSASEGAVEISSQKLKERVQKRHQERGEESALAFRNFTNARKMSEIIIEFAEPLLQEADSFESRKTALSMAIFAWNLSMMPDYQTRIDELCGAKSDRKAKRKEAPFDFELLGAMSLLVRRKQELYSDVRRLVVDYDVVDTGEGRLHLNVVSSILPDDSEIENFEKEFHGEDLK